MKKKTDLQPDIFTFFDYREYLQSIYEWRKRTESGFSHRSFAKEAGIVSPNYLHRVLKRERELSEEYGNKFAAALKLHGNDLLYFSTLVRFNQEQDSAKKEELLRTLLALRYRRGVHHIYDKKLQFFSKWYYPVLRELAIIIDFNDDYNILARNCLPKITAQQAENGIAYLVKQGFLTKNEDGTFTRSDPVISSGDEVASTVLRNYHKQTLSQSIDALDSIDREERDISSVTLSVSKTTYLAMKKEIQDFRKRLLAMAKEDQEPQMVCLAGFQLLPRSKISTQKQPGRTNA
jgi:uncharacterized protein (TIGR02147 family)